MPNVLLVEDNQTFRMAVLAALQRRGYAVTYAANGSEALKILETQRPDIVILDLVMPDMDGLTVLRRMRLSPALADVPVIVLAGMISENQMLRAKELGAESLIKCCVTMKELCQRIGERLQATAVAAY